MTTYNEINMSVYDLTTVLASGYTNISVYHSETINGTYSEITSASTSPVLASNTEYYQYIHEGSGIINDFYKFKYTHASASSAFITKQFYANTSDLTELLRYDIEDICDDWTKRRYSIKELRRFIYKSLTALSKTLYVTRFRADYNGIITPRTSERDIGIILLQAKIIVMQSQLTRAADQNISFADGRGRFNNRTHAALKDSIKILQQELKESIADVSRGLIIVKRVIVSS